MSDPRFTIPPFPGETLVTPSQLAVRCGCSTAAIRYKIQDGVIAAVTVAGRVLITETEAARFIRDWPVKNRGVAARWRAYREWKAQHVAAEVA